MALTAGDLQISGTFTGTKDAEWQVDYATLSSTISKFSWKTRDIGTTSWGDSSALYLASDYVNNGVDGTTITVPGSGYDELNPPAVTVTSPPNGITARITAVVNNTGNLTGLTVTNAGAGYSEVPLITIDAPSSGIRAEATVDALDSNNKLSVGSGIYINFTRDISGEYNGISDVTFWWSFSGLLTFEKSYSRIHPFLNTSNFNLLGYTSSGEVEYLEDIYAKNLTTSFTASSIGSFPPSTKISIHTRGNDNFIGCGKDFPPHYIGFPNTKQFGASNEGLIMANGELRLVSSSMEGLEQVVIANGDATADADTTYIGYQKESPLLVLFDKDGVITTFNVGGAITAMSLCTTSSTKVWIAYRGSAWGSVARMAVGAASIDFDDNNGKKAYFSVRGTVGNEIPSAQEQDDYISDILYTENGNAEADSGRLFLQRYKDDENFYFQYNWTGHKFYLYRFNPLYDYSNNPIGNGEELSLNTSGAGIMVAPPYGHLNSPSDFDGESESLKNGAFYHITRNKKFVRVDTPTYVNGVISDDAIVCPHDTGSGLGGDNLHPQHNCNHDSAIHKWSYYEHDSDTYAIKAFSNAELQGGARYAIRLAKRGLILYSKESTEYSIGLTVSNFKLKGAEEGDRIGMELYEEDEGIVNLDYVIDEYPHGQAGINFPTNSDPAIGCDAAEFAQPADWVSAKYKRYMAGPFFCIADELRVMNQHIVTFNDAESYNQAAGWAANGSMNSFFPIHKDDTWVGQIYSGIGGGTAGFTFPDDVTHIQAQDKFPIHDVVVGDIVGKHPAAIAVVSQGSQANSPASVIPTFNDDGSCDYSKQASKFGHFHINQQTPLLSFSDVESGNLGLGPRIIPGTGTAGEQNLAQVSLFRKSGQFNMDNIDWGIAGTNHPGTTGTNATVDNPTSISVTAAALTGGSDPQDKNNLMPGEDDTAVTNSYHKNFYKFSVMFDGYLETALSQDIATHTGDNPSKKGHEITILINNDNLNKRISHIQIYRGVAVHDGGGLANIIKPDFDYRLVESVSLNSVDWDITTVSSVSYFRYRLKDNQGKNFGTYESNTGISPEMRVTHLRYSLAAPVTGYLFVGDAKNGFTGEVPNHIFRSKPGKYPIFNWATEYTVLPEKPNCLIGFMDKLFAFTPSRGFIINPETLTIMDELNGSGCLSDHSFIVTDFGLFYADRNGIYRHDGRQSQPIGQSILDSDHTDLSPYAWQRINWENNDLLMGFDSQRNAVLYIFGDPLSVTKSVAWVYTIRSNRWDLWKFDDKITSVCQGQHGEIIANGNALFTVATDKTGNEDWEYQTKKLTANLDTEDKHFMAVYSVGDNTPTTKYKTEKYTSAWLSLSAAGRVDSSYKKSKWMEIQLTGTGTDTIDSVGYHYRPLKVKQEKA